VLVQEWFDGNETTSLLHFYGFLVLTQGAKSFLLALPRKIVVVNWFVCFVKRCQNEIPHCHDQEKEIYFTSLSMLLLVLMTMMTMMTMMMMMMMMMMVSWKR